MAHITRRFGLYMFREKNKASETLSGQKQILAGVILNIML